MAGMEGQRLMAYPFDKIKLPHIIFSEGSLFCNVDGSFKIAKGHDPIFRITDPESAKKIAKFLYDVYLNPDPLPVLYENMEKSERKQAVPQLDQTCVPAPPPPPPMNWKGTDGEPKLDPRTGAKIICDEPFNDKSRCDSKTQNNGTQTWHAEDHHPHPY
jgi:hypothetical protein